MRSWTAWPNQTHCSRPLAPASCYSWEEEIKALRAYRESVQANPKEAAPVAAAEKLPKPNARIPIKKNKQVTTEVRRPFSSTDGSSFLTPSPLPLQSTLLAGMVKRKSTEGRREDADGDDDVSPKKAKLGSGATTAAANPDPTSAGAVAVTAVAPAPKQAAANKMASLLGDYGSDSDSD